MDHQQRNRFRTRAAKLLSRFRTQVVLGVVAFISILFATLFIVDSEEIFNRFKGLEDNDIAILSLGLIDTSTQTKLVDLEDGMVIDIAQFEREDALTSFSVSAIISDEDGSVLFGYGDIVEYSVDNYAPMAMCGNSGVQYIACPELGRLGTHVITATPYSDKLLGGQQGIPFEVTFSFVREASAFDKEFSQPAAVVDSVSPNITIEKRSCPIPKWDGEWEWGQFQYPISVAEAQGGRMGDELLVIGGFKDGYSDTTTETYTLNMSNPELGWARLDDMPVPIGITHAAFANIDDTTMILCGGYIGGNIGPETDQCLEFNHSKPTGQQWNSFESLPDGRAGGGMIFNDEHQQLVFAGGAKRPSPGMSVAFDFNDTWIYDFNEPDAGWTQGAPIPFLGNHMSFVTALDDVNRERHFLLGGQTGENEEHGNTDEVYEWDADDQSWVAHPDMPMTRGHSASATKAISCGFIVAGGTTNENGLTADISYYDIPTGNWTKLGDLPNSVNTVVCDFGNHYLYCESGWATGRYSARRKIIDF